MKGSQVLWDLTLMLYFGLVIILSKTDWKGLSLAGGSKLRLSVGFLGYTFVLKLVLSKVPSLVTLGYVYLVVPIAHLFLDYAKSID